MVVLLHVHDVVEHVAATIERVVGVEHNETETSAVAMAEGFDVVAQPVVAAQIHLCRHVVHVLIDVEHLADVLIDAVVVGVGRQRDKLLIYLVIAALLHVERVGRDFKLVDFIVVPAVVGIDVVLVIGLTNVQDTDVLAIDELMHGLIGLHIDVDARGLYDGLNGRVFDSTTVVIAAVANLQRAVVDVRLGCKERISEFLLAAQFLRALQFEGVGCPRTTPATAHLKVDVLVENHLAIGVEIGEVDGSLPVHVPVAFRRLTVSGTSVFATHIDAQ